MFLLLLSAVVGFISGPPRNKIGHQTAQHVKVLHVKPYALDQNAPVAPQRESGDRRRKLRALAQRAVPKKRNLACLAIAALAYLRGPSLISGDMDPNVAHAGRIDVKVSDVKVQATLKVPLKPAAATSRAVKKAPRTVERTTRSTQNTERAVTRKKYTKEPSSVAKGVKKVITSDLPSLMTSTSGSLVIAAGGGILAGGYSRRSGGEGGRETRAQDYVENMLTVKSEE